jgi:hypothetical protein
LANDLAAENWGVVLQKRVSRLAPAWRRRIGVALCATLIAVDGKRPLQLIWRGGGEVDGCAHWSRTFRFPIKSSNRALSEKRRRLSPFLLWRLSKTHAWSATVLVDELDPGADALISSPLLFIHPERGSPSRNHEL